MTQPATVEWVLDTRDIWKVPEGKKVSDRPRTNEMLDFADVKASNGLDRLTKEETDNVMKYHYAKDAKLSLGSNLLKRHAISQLTGTPWADAKPSKDKHGKPFFDNKGDTSKAIDFNVSHQAGLVTLIASTEPESTVGTDIVCVNERNDYSTIDPEGFFNWVDIHGDVFAPSEIEYMKTNTETLPIPGIEHQSGFTRDAIAECQHRGQNLTWSSPSGVNYTIDSSVVIEAKLRRFYAFWCLREAYVKMTGEALLADWLNELEFRHFKVPKPAKPPSPSSDSSEEKPELRIGEVISEIEIYFKGRKVNNVTMELSAMGQDFMVASAVKTGVPLEEEAHVDLPGYEKIELEKDVYPHAAILKSSA